MICKIHDMLRVAVKSNTPVTDPGCPPEEQGEFSLCMLVNTVGLTLHRMVAVLHLSGEGHWRAYTQGSSLQW